MNAFGQISSVVIVALPLVALAVAGLSVAFLRD
jgi:hypothetical protein